MRVQDRQFRRMDEAGKRGIKIACLAGALLLLAAGGLWWGRAAYRNWRQQRLLAQAQAFMTKGELGNALLSVRRALFSNPSNLAACQLMAGLAEKAGSPAVLDWRRRIAEVAPTLDNRLRLASAAVRLEGPPYPLAAQILNDLSTEATNLPFYHVVSAELAVRLKKLDEAEAHYQAAARLEPANEQHQFNLAALHLGSTNLNLAAQGRATLESLCRNTNFGALALGWLVNDCGRRNDLAAAAVYSEQLVAHPRCTPEDRLQRLNILSLSGSPQFTPYLESLQNRATTNVVEVRGLCAWLIQRERAGEALQWLTNLPSAARSQQPVQLATTECYVALKDWPAVQAFLKDQHWAESEFLREAFLSQAALRAEEPVAAGFHWKNAVREAGDRIGPMAMLLDLAGTWQRSGDKADLLWRVYGRYPKERWALQELARIFRAEKNTLGLYKLSVELEKLNPDDPVAKNNLAATSLLLKLNVSKAYEVAKELHTSRPDDPIIASTYAFALHLLGRTQEGVAVLAQLKPAALEEPAVALYYGVLLSASGQAGQAKKYLNLCHAAPLLPEEQQLLDDALTSL